MSFKKQRAKTRQRRIRPMPQLKKAMEATTCDPDKTFTQHDHDMAHELFEDSKSMSIFYCTFNTSANGNNPQEGVK